MVECGFMSTETVDLLGTGAQDGHLDFHTAPELWRSAGMGLVPNMSALHNYEDIRTHRGVWMWEKATIKQTQAQ